MFSGRKSGTKALSSFKRYLWPKTYLNSELVADPEVELSVYHRLASSHSESPSEFLNEEGPKKYPIADLDIFFERLYIYYREKGLWCIIINWIVELLSLSFIVIFSLFSLLIVDWTGLLKAKCGLDAPESGSLPCNLSKIVLLHHPLVPFTFAKAIILGYLATLTIYLLFCFLRFFKQLKGTLEIRKFYNGCLNVTDREVQTTPWPVILEKIVVIQQKRQLCVVKNLSSHEVVMRIMRKENYLIGMVNKGLLAFPIPSWIPGAGPGLKTGPNRRTNHLVLTKILEWTIYQGILHWMFDRNNCIRRDFISDSSSLRKRLLKVGITMFFLSPFLMIFMLVFFFLRHAEQFYKHPSTVFSRRWSNLSRSIFREYNEVEHLFKQRLNNCLTHSSDYLKLFPSHITSHVAKLISFVFGGLAIILILLSFIQESLLEGHIFGHNLLWYTAVFGTLTVISRAIVTNDNCIVLDPEEALSLVNQHTHYFPKRWRGKANTDPVRLEFETLFQYIGMMLLEDMVSIFLTPYFLVFVLPKRVDEILQFISDFTIYVEGVGDVCSFSTFDFESHGSSKYGSHINAPRDRRSSQGKMEKSFLSFHNTYPSWQPNIQGQQYLSNMCNFIEEKTNQHTKCARSPIDQGKQNQSSRAQDELFHRFPSTYMAYGGVRLVNHQKRVLPHHLDWYYISKSLIHEADNSRPTALPISSGGNFGPMNDNERTMDKLDNYWNFPPPNRLPTDLLASFSKPVNHGSIFHQFDSGDPKHITESRWWARPPPPSTGPENSFLEPPNLFQQNFITHDSISSDILEDGEKEASRIELRKLHSLSRTTRVDNNPDDEAFCLPFSDVYSGTGS